MSSNSTDNMPPDFQDICENTLILTTSFFAALFAVSEMLAIIPHVKSNGIVHYILTFFCKDEQLIEDTEGLISRLISETNSQQSDHNQRRSKTPSEVDTTDRDSDFDVEENKPRKKKKKSKKSKTQQTHNNTVNIRNQL